MTNEHEKAIDERACEDLNQQAERAARERESGLGPKPKPIVILGHEAARRALRR